MGPGPARETGRVRLLLLVNGAASSVTARTKVVIAKALSADHDVTVSETTRRGNATRQAQGAAHDGYEVVVTLGGDGTFNEAANGLAGTATALAGLPGGSTNVFARTLGFPNDPVESASVLLDALDRGDIRPVGLGQVGTRYFLFHCGIGFDAAVVERVERRSTLKRWAGHPLFAWSAAAAWATSSHRPSFRLRIGEEEIPAAFAVVLNTDPYTYLGNRPFRVAPDATLDDPLAVVALRTTRLATLLPVAARALGRGLDGGRLHGVTYRPRVVEATLTADRPVPYQVDGELLGTATSLTFRWHHDALRLVVPHVAEEPRG
jgi:diacylglycerol kinase family enzyme